jgi:hypothetical protein
MVFSPWSGKHISFKQLVGKQHILVGAYGKAKLNNFMAVRNQKRKEKKGPGSKYLL